MWRLGMAAAAVAVAVGAPPAAAEELPPGGTFIDDDANLHEGAIEAIAARGITNGCQASDPRYCPDAPVLRAEAVAFILRATGHAGDLSSGGGAFADVAADDWYAPYVERAWELGVTRGCDRGGTRFCPDRPVSREQVASLIVRAWRLPSSPVDAFFDDDASIHQADINALAGAGITRGCGTGRYCPTESTGRDEMASLLARAGGMSPIVPPPRFSHQPIDSSLRGRMPYSWREGCPVPLEDLRLLNVEHWGFDGQRLRGELVVHGQYAEPVLMVLRTLFEARFPIERIELVDRYRGDDLASMEANNTSGFNCRQVTGRPGVWSEHAYGRAIDVNPVQNPYLAADGTVLPGAGTAYLDRTRLQPGMIQPGDVVVEAFRQIGWEWGGTWSTIKDYQHFSATGR